jgi:hypothetical protein
MINIMLAPKSMLKIAMNFMSAKTASRYQTIRLTPSLFP